ncbi:MAG: class D sortase [Oscillospiraceae bacterium]
MYDGLTREHLWLGVARTEESAKPGDKDNCVVFGHRDSAFRCLKDVKLGSKVTITDSRNKYTYTVEKTQICAPESPDITQSYDSAHLTLVTCYPFIYSGPAAERYLVICKLESSKKL